MAWISVHEDVVGPKLRKLVKHSELSRNEALGTLIVLWLWGIKNADPNGLIKSADRGDVADVIASGLSDGAAAAKVVDCMVEAGWIDDCDGELYLHDWDEWQEMWYTYLGRKEKDTARKRRAREKGRNEEEPSDIPVPPALPPPQPPMEPQTPPEPEPQKKQAYPSGFEAFWKAYPRNIDKGSAYKKYSARRKDGYSDEELVAAARNYAGQCKAKKTEAEYIKHPKTFLSDTMPFLDFLPKREAESGDAVTDDKNPFAEWGEKND